MNRVIVACCILLCTSVWKISAQDYPFRRADLPVEERVEDLVRRMTLEEKIDLLAGYQDFYLHPCERLGIPAFKLADGPLGLASWGLFGKATAFPSALSLAASWNRDLAARVGDCYGQEWRARGIHFLLAPGVNTYRASKGARNFEYMGEDPYLSSEMVVPFIKGVQERGVIATVKHFAANDQEYDRYRVSSEVSERALREIYLPAFKAAVQKAGVKAVMTGYNLLNGVFGRRRAVVHPLILAESLSRASLLDLVDAANNLLARTNRTQLLLVTNQDVGLAVDLLGDLTLKVTAAKRRRGDLHIGLRRRLIRRI